MDENELLRSELSTDIDENVLYVSQGYDPAAAHGKEITLMGFRLLSGKWEDECGKLTDELPEGMVDVKFKIRHTPEFHQGHLSRLSDGLVRLESDEPIQGIAAGQYATIYDNNAHLVVASGMII